MYLITGATGGVGRPLIERLLSTGAKVRALSRDPATAFLPDDVEVARTDEMPMDGIEAVFFNPATTWSDPTGLTAKLVAKAQAHGVRRVVMLSTLTCLWADEPSNLIGRQHLEMERVIEASGMEWTFLRPGTFATNCLTWAAQIRLTGVVQEAYPEFSTAPIHERDIACVAALSLLTNELVGARPALTGPEALTHADMARLIGEAIGRPVRCERIPPGVARERMSAYMPAPIVDAMLRMQAESLGGPADIHDDVERITGRPARTFADWAADHAADFH